MEIAIWNFKSGRRASVRAETFYMYVDRKHTGQAWYMWALHETPFGTHGRIGCMEAQRRPQDFPLTWYGATKEPCPSRGRPVVSCRIYLHVDTCSIVCHSSQERTLLPYTLAWCLLVKGSHGDELANFEDVPYSLEGLPWFSSHTFWNCATLGQAMPWSPKELRPGWQRASAASLYPWAAGIWHIWRITSSSQAMGLLWHVRGAEGRTFLERRNRWRGSIPSKRTRWMGRIGRGI